MAKKLDINVAKSFFEDHNEKISDLKTKPAVPVLSESLIADNSTENAKIKPTNNKQTIKLTNKGYYMSDEIYKKLLLAYAETQIDMSKIVRAALSEYLNNHSYENIIKLLKNNKDI